MYEKPCRHAQPHTNHKPIPQRIESSSLHSESNFAFGYNRKSQSSRKKKSLASSSFAKSSSFAESSSFAKSSSLVESSSFRFLSSIL